MGLGGGVQQLSIPHRIQSIHLFASLKVSSLIADKNICCSLVATHGRDALGCISHVQEEREKLGRQLLLEVAENIPIGEERRRKARENYF